MEAPTIRLNASDLARSLAPLISLVPEKPIYAALGSLIISQIGNGFISLTAGNSNQRMHLIMGGIDCVEDNPFVSLPEFSPFYALLRAIGNEEISLVQESDSLSVITSTSSIVFPTITPALYPTLGLDKGPRTTTTLDEYSAVKMSESLLTLEGFSKKSTEFVSPLSGIWLTNVDGFLRATAADFSIGADETMPISWSLVDPLFISNETIVPVAKMLASVDSGEVLIEVTENWVGFNINNNQLWCRRQSVTAPNLAILWPADDDKGFTGNWTIDKLPLIQSLKRIASLPGLPAKSGVSHLAEFHTNDGSPMISYNFESYHADETCGDYDGPEPQFSMGMGMDVKKLLIVANSFPGNTLHFSLNPTNERQRVIYVTDEKSNKRALFMLLATNLH